MFPFFMILDVLGWFRVNALEELVGLDATYAQDSAPKKLFDDDSSTNQEERLEAYKQRFEERRENRVNQRGKNSVDDVLKMSWGNGLVLSEDGDGVSNDGQSRDGRSVDMREFEDSSYESGLREQAPPRREPKKVAEERVEV
jgi:hypothetical protein